MICFGLSSFAQLDDKEKFREPLLREVNTNDKENANINYCLGLAIYNTIEKKDKKGALPYLLSASKKVDPNYSYLGKTQYNDYQFLEAIESFCETMN